MLVITLKRAAGRIAFGPDQQLDIPDDQVQELIDCGAVVPVKKPEPKVVEKPKRVVNVNQGK